MVDSSKAITTGILNALAIITGTVLFFFLMYQIRSVLLYIVVAATISLMGKPIVYFLTTTLKIRRNLAVMLCLVLFLFIIAGIFSLFLPILLEQTQILRTINIQNIGTQFNTIIQEFANHFNIENFNALELIGQTDLIKYLNFSFIPDLINSLLSGFTGFMIGLFSVIFIAFFTLKDANLLRNVFMLFVKKDDEEKIINIFSKTGELLSRYFLGLMLQIAILFVLYSILMLVLGIKNAIALALIAAVFNLIPYLGPLIGCFFMLSLTITGHIDMDFSTVILPKVTYVVIGYIVVQIIDNFVNQPFIFSSSVRSHPLEIFLAILIFGILFGVLGLIAAVPFYTTIKVILKELLSEYKVVRSLTKKM